MTYAYLLYFIHSLILDICTVCWIVIMSAVHFVRLQPHLYLMHSTLSDIGRVR